jgi:hypothetical protein
VLHESVFDRRQNVPEYCPNNLVGTDYPRERYAPLFPDAPGYMKTPDGQLASLQSDERRFDNMDAVGRVQAILDFKLDANPMLQSPPDMWPGFPILAALFTLVATLLIRPPGELSYWFLGEIIFFWLLRQGFRKLYRAGLVTHYKQHRDELAKSVPSEPPKEPPPYIRARWKAVCQLVGGLVPAVAVMCFRRPDSNESWTVFAALALLAIGLLSALATWAQARAFNAVLAVWAEASDTPQFREYSRRSMEYRRALEKAPTGESHA